MGPEVRETKGHEEIQKKTEDCAGPGLTSSSGQVLSAGFVPQPVGMHKEVFCPAAQDLTVADWCPAHLISFTGKAHNDADKSY